LYNGSQKEEIGNKKAVA